MVRDGCEAQATQLFLTPRPIGRSCHRFTCPRGLVVEKLIRVHLAGARLLLLQRPGWRAGQHCHHCLRTGLFRLSDIAGFFLERPGRRGGQRKQRSHSPPGLWESSESVEEPESGGSREPSPKRFVFPESIPAAQPTEAKPANKLPTCQRSETSKDLGRNQVKPDLTQERKRLRHQNMRGRKFGQGMRSARVLGGWVWVG